MMHLTQKQIRRAAAVEYNLGGPDFHGDLPEGVRDRIHTEVGVALGWLDRLKVLVGWRIELEVRTNTEHQPGMCRSFTDIRIVRPDWIARKPKGGYAAVLPEENSPARK